MLFFLENIAGYIALGLTCFLAVAVITHLLVKQREEKASQQNKEKEFNQKIEKLVADNNELRNRESKLLIEFEGNRQKLQQLEEESNKTLIELESTKQRIEELEKINQSLLIKSEGDNQRLLQLENTRQELLIKAESYWQKLQELEQKNKGLLIKDVENAQKIQQLEENKLNQSNELKQQAHKIEELQKINNQLLIESEGAKKLQEVSVDYSRFYKEFLDKGLDRELDNLVKYQEFYSENFHRVEEWKQQLDLEKNRIRAGKIYEGNWGERIYQIFNSEELDYIELEAQPSSSKGDKADFKLVFRNSRNKQNSTNSIRIMIELKYSFEDISSESQFAITKADLKKALEVARYSPEPYNFIFLVTNREFELEEYQKSETIWVVSDRDYQTFGLGSSRLRSEPIVAIMSPEASFRWLRMFYLMFWMAPNNRRVDTIEEDNYSSEKLNQQIADFIKECHNMTSASEGISSGILTDVEKFWSEVEKKFKQLKNKLLKQAKELQNVKNKNSALWGEWRTLSLNFSEQLEEVVALPTSTEES